MVRLLLAALLMLSGQHVITGLVASRRSGTGAAPCSGKVNGRCRKAEERCEDGLLRISYLGCPPRSSSRGSLSTAKRYRRFLNGKPRQRRLPEEETFSRVAQYAFALVTLHIFVLLAGMSFGLIEPMKVQPNQVWLVFPLSQIYFHLAQAGLGPWIGAVPVDPEPMQIGVGAATWVHTAFGVFTALVMQAMCFITLCRLGPKHMLAHVMYPPSTIYTLACAYYAYHVMGSPLHIETDVFGLGFYPMHMVLWMCSTSVQTVLWKQIHHIQCVGGPLTAFELPARAILLTYVMLWTGLVGSIDFSYGDLNPYGIGKRFIAPNVVLNVISFATFYLLLSQGTNSLRESVDFYRVLYRKRRAEEQRSGREMRPPNGALATAHAARVQQNNFQFAFWYVWISWHAFPIVWALGCAGLVDAPTRETMYLLCDLMAKFLPVSIYLSLLAVQ